MGTGQPKTITVYPFTAEIVNNLVFDNIPHGNYRIYHKLNDIDFGIYIEDVLTRIMYGEHVDDTFLPCGYVPRYKEGQDAA